MNPVKIKIKPLSVNEAWMGRRFKTPKYKAYREELEYALPDIPKFPTPPYEIWYEFGLSNKRSDYDNPIKTTQDALQDKYAFDDADIMIAHIKKVVVAKGEEYVQFLIRSVNQGDSAKITGSACDFIKKDR